MILINPRGKEVEFSDEKAKRFLSIPAKIKQGWKKKVAKRKVAKRKVNGQSNNKK